MQDKKYVFGPVPSRRLGQSLGVSPIPEKTCNYSCVYCQLGRTNKMTNTRREFYPLADILAEVKESLEAHAPCDVISIVGEGEPTLYLRLGELISGIKSLTEKPVAVITNGALLCDPAVRQELMGADIVLPSLDAYDLESFKAIDRPHGKISFEDTFEGLISFARKFTGQLWLEIMLVDGMNTSDEAIEKLSEMAQRVRHDRLYINTPVRPPAESFARAAAPEAIAKAAELCGGISIDKLSDGSFYSDIKDSFEAIATIARRHPMTRFEIESFLSARGEQDIPSVLKRLEMDNRVTTLDYKGIVSYRVN